MAVLVSLGDDPRRWIREWNWKAAITSSCARGALFFGLNLSSGLDAAQAAMLTEVALRAVTAGFYGSLTARFRHAEPRWMATLTASLLLPIVSHSFELAVHWMRGTPALLTSVGGSALFTVLSTSINLHLMRHGVLTVGAGAGSLADDLRAVPRLLFGFALGGRTVRSARSATPARSS